MYVVNNVARRALATARIVVVRLVAPWKARGNIAIEKRYENSACHSQDEFRCHLYFAAILDLRRELPEPSRDPGAVG